MTIAKRQRIYEHLSDLLRQGRKISDRHEQTKQARASIQTRYTHHLQGRGSVIEEEMEAQIGELETTTARSGQAHHTARPDSQSDPAFRW